MKTITDMPCVSKKIAQKLEDLCIETPVQLMGQFMVICLARLILPRTCDSSQFVPDHAHPVAVRFAALFDRQTLSPGLEMQ